MIYLNQAATSWPKAPGVSQAVAEAISAAPGDGRRATVGGAGTHHCRALLAELLGVASPRSVVLTANATHALNIALLGFPWRPGDRVVTTQAEHNSVLRPLYRLKKLGILDYTVLPVGRDGRVDAHVWARALREAKPRLAVFTHASNVSGAVNDAAALTRAAKDAGAAVLVDASQTIGLLPVTPQVWGADMAAFTGHKYLLGPQGTGGLYVGPEVCLSAVYTGGTGVRSDEDEMPENLPERLEAGTGNEPSFAGLAAAISYQKSNPPDMGAISSLLHRFEIGLRNLGMETIEVAGPRTPVISAVSGKYPPNLIGEMLASGFDIVCRTGLHCAPLYPNTPGGTVRFSLSRFTTHEEIDDTLQALWEILN